MNGIKNVLSRLLNSSRSSSLKVASKPTKLFDRFSLNFNRSLKHVDIKKEKVKIIETPLIDSDIQILEVVPPPRYKRPKSRRILQVINLNNKIYYLQNILFIFKRHFSNKLKNLKV